MTIVNHTFVRMSSAFQIVVSLANSAIHHEPISADIKTLDFGSVIRCARRQAVDGMLADLPLHTYVAPQDKMLFAQWAASVAALEKLHHTHNSEIVRIASIFATANIRYALLKGQCSASHYPIPAHRRIGDIDIYVSPAHFSKASLAMNKLGYTFDREYPIHAIYKKDNFDIELHKTLQNTYWWPSKRRLTRFLAAHFDNENISIPQMQIFQYQVNILPPEIEVLLHTLHIRKHFTSSGIGLRHIYDWSLCWERYKCDVNWPQLREILEGTHAMRMFRILFYFAITHLGFRWSEMMLNGKPLTSSEIKLAKKLWLMVEETGNFGNDLKHDVGISIVHNVYELYLKRRMQAFALSHTEVTAELLHKFFQIITGGLARRNFKRFLPQSSNK